MTKEVTVLKKEVSPFVKAAKDLEIVSKESLEEAVTVLTTINRFSDEVTKEKEKVTKPLNEALKAERARWKPVELLIEEAVGIIKGKMTVFQTAEMKRLKQEEDRIAKSVTRGGSVEKAVEAIAELDKPEIKVSGGVGSVKFREVSTLKIVNEKKIPKEFWVIDEKKLLEVLKGGILVPGAEIEIIQVPTNYRA